jgi:hypothetical protein
MKPRTSAESPGQQAASTAPQPAQSHHVSLPGQPALGAYQPQPTGQQVQPPPKPPTKSTLKALPTVRDHTTDQLNPAGDEYMPREKDESGEQKVMLNGCLTGGRKYRCKTFLVPKRGDKLFMLATECARVLGYRDSYLLFNKNRSLYKIIANQEEKDDLVSQEVLPFSYRSRQIAIVTARSMFRQFGSRVIMDGRRVRDDYWEAKARKQGFTEADMAGEKRPGGAKAREAAAAEAAAAAAAAAAAVQTHGAVMNNAHHEVVYANAPGQFPAPPQAAMVQQGMVGVPPGASQRTSMVTLASPDLGDTRSRDFSGILKGGPRQEITGPPYSDATRPTPLSEIQSSAHHAADFNRALNQQREMRADYTNSAWRKPLEQPQPQPQHHQQQQQQQQHHQQHHHQQSAQQSSSGASGQPGSSEAGLPATSRTSQSPHAATAGVAQSGPGVMPSQSPQMMLSNSPYSQQASGPHGSIGQAPIRGLAPAGSTGSNYPSSSHLWGQQPATPQQQGYPSYTTQGQQQPHSQPSPSSASRPAPQPQLRHPSSGQMQSGIQFPMPGIQGYGHAQGVYADHTPRQYHMSPSNPGTPAAPQGWNNQQAQGQQQWWANQQ